MPYTSSSSTEKRLINLAIYVMLLVSESGDIESQANPLYAELVPWPASWAATPPGPPETGPTTTVAPIFGATV